MRSIKLSFLICILIAVAICVSQIVGSTALLAGCFVVYLFFALFAVIRKFAIPVLMFFLPWSPLLKFAPGNPTFFSIALLLVAAYYVVNKRFAFKTYHIVIPVLLIALTLLSKLIDGCMPSAEYVLFMTLLICLPFASEEIDREYDFETLTMFYATGIIMAAMFAQWLAIYPNIAKYIDIYVFGSITRYSGFYGDANFYSAQISAAISGVLMIIVKEKNTKKAVLFAIVGVVLLYCGLISASKSFAIVIALTTLIWLVGVMTSKCNYSVKFLVITGLTAVVILAMSTTFFKEALLIIKTRFSQANNISSFTTGRTKRWGEYAALLTNDLKVLFMGVGFTDVKVNGWASHNTIIQMVFQFGLIGTAFLMGWILRFAQSIMGTSKLSGRDGLEFAVIACGAFLPWMAVDILFFDEFFIIQLYAYFAATYIKNHNSYIQLKT